MEFANVLTYDSVTGEIGQIDASGSDVKSFIITHPEDSTKYLVHACLEGPESGVYYRGRGTIAARGTSVAITLPSYVDSLILADPAPSINITPIYNGSAVRTLNVSAYVSRTNTFTVYGTPGDFDWIFYGTRVAITVAPRKSRVRVKGLGPYKFI